MRRSSLFAVAALQLLFVLAVPLLYGQTESILYGFGAYLNAANPDAGLVFDKSGNLYGTTGSGGAFENGAVFELVPGTNGVWTEQLLYSFCAQPNCSDGEWPITTLVIDANGNLYGTTYYGGNTGCGNGGCGVVFELSPSNAGWSEKVLYTFTGGPDGSKPLAGLVFDRGNLYGTTAYGGNGPCNTFWAGCGVVFELSPQSDGTWKERVLHSFAGGTDSDTPSSRLAIDKVGNLYGTTAGSAPADPGTVYKISRDKTGWKETVLHAFSGIHDGNSPESDVVLDATGNVYGTTRYGGTGSCSIYGYNGCGTIFQLKNVNGAWKEKVLHSFLGVDGAYPAAGVIFDSSGSLYGTTAGGGASQNCGTLGCGTLFKLTHTGSIWGLTSLYSFMNNSDGAYPLGDLIFDAAGNLYSTTQYGGPNILGTAFEIVP